MHGVPYHYLPTTTLSLRCGFRWGLGGRGRWAGGFSAPAYTAACHDSKYQNSHQNQGVQDFPHGLTPINLSVKYHRG
ncbi:hypothetical protein PYCH_17090 [Pyrococcus yayanosii CH1]|uniref:Uncharacterized protein n=1 Tax=Pyrococcus yayanosii (strain CH1 / JCM 16557) TaxID=529709 RepID=F8AHJ6_PYRYC|nr:hypothetical protein PYCH_17090 [Pyrococcus yayanosii CH1]